MDDALTRIAHIEMRDLVFTAIARQRFQLNLSHRIRNSMDVLGRHVVIGHGHRRIGAPQITACELQALECLWRGDFMRDMPIDINQG